MTAKKKQAKRIGRPRTGTGAPVMVRMNATQLQALDRWIGKTGISRPEAIRQLIDWALQQTTAAQTEEPPPLHTVRRAQIRERAL